MIWFISDLHFNHRNIIHYCGRPYDTVETMNRDLIVNWNMNVGSRDTVYCLGDFGLVRKDMPHPREYLKQLSGTIVMVQGNHDDPKQWTRDGNANPFDPRGIVEVRWNHLIFVLCHYPMESWNRQHYGSVHLHGHVHNNDAHLKKIPNRINVSVERIDYRPISVVEIMEEFYIDLTKTKKDETTLDNRNTDVI